MLIPNEVSKWIDMLIDPSVVIGNTITNHDQYSMSLYQKNQQHRDYQQQQNTNTTIPGLSHIHSPPNLDCNSPQTVADLSSPKSDMGTPFYPYDIDNITLPIAEELHKRKSGRKPRTFIDPFSGVRRYLNEKEKKEIRLNRNKFAADLSRKRRKERFAIMYIYAQKLCVINYELKSKVIELLQARSPMQLEPQTISKDNTKNTIENIE